MESQTTLTEKLESHALRSMAIFDRFRARESQTNRVGLSRAKSVESCCESERVVGVPDSLNGKIGLPRAPIQGNFSPISRAGVPDNRLGLSRAKSVKRKNWTPTRSDPREFFCRFRARESQPRSQKSHAQHVHMIIARLWVRCPEKGRCAIPRLRAQVAEVACATCAHMIIARLWARCLEKGRCAIPCLRAQVAEVACANMCTHDHCKALGEMPWKRAMRNSMLVCPEKGLACPRQHACVP